MIDCLIDFLAPLTADRNPILQQNLGFYQGQSIPFHGGRVMGIFYLKRLLVGLQRKLWE